MKRLETPKWQQKNTTRKKFTLAALVAFLVLPLGVGIYFLSGYLFGGDGLEVAGSTITVRVGGNFQAAIDRAKSGDTIILQAGANYVGNFVLPNKPGGEYITIQSSEIAKLPEGVRVTPANAALMPKVLSAGGGESAVRTAPGAHHYRFVGIEFAPNGNDKVYNLVGFGSDNQTAADVARNLELDRCYLHPNPKGRTRRGVMLNSADTVIRNSYLAGFQSPDEETQAIAGWNGPGGYKIVNNYLEAGAQSIIFGGADPGIKNLVPTNIEIRNNYMTKPAEWRGKVSIKCTFELKNAKNVTVAGNVIENSFDEIAVRLTVRNQGGTAPWSTIEDVVMRDNVIRNSGGGINILGTDDVYPSATMKRVQIVNNLFTGIDTKKYGGDGILFKITAAEDVTIANNTAVHDGNLITAYGKPARRFAFRANIASWNSYGFVGEGIVGKAVLQNQLPGSMFSENVIVNGRTVPKNEVIVPAGNFYVDNFAGVGFLDFDRGNFRLGAKSRFANRKIGCDFEILDPEIKKASGK